MLQGLFQSTTIPVLEEVVNFSQARHTVLAGNIANLDVPGYQARDLSLDDFQDRLKTAIEERDAPAATPTTLSAGGTGDVKPLTAGIAKSAQTVLRHDGNDVGMEVQVTEMAKNQVQHNLALTIMTDQFRLLQTAISGRV
jgi:flagellar basal-body rod protein FlgB